MKKSYIFLIAIVVLLLGWIVIRNNNQFDIPSGETTILEQENLEDEEIDDKEETDDKEEENEEMEPEQNIKISRAESDRAIFVTDGVKHSIVLDEILSGGPPKDGIPSIDSPDFISVKDAEEFLTDGSIGLGLNYKGEERFYPYQILVWHELVNDIVAGDPLLVSYCPLCATGVVFDRTIEGEGREFGVSGKLWRSNLLMYDRTGSSETESLWSQVLGEAVLGPATGQRLEIVRSDTVQFGDWKAKHPDTRVLSRNTGAIRTYGADPYGDYYTDRSVSFGASFNDDRLHPKAFVFGLEIDNQFKAYPQEDLPVGETVDTFSGLQITVKKEADDTVGFFTNGQEIQTINGFWFSWLAAHPETELYSN